MGNDPNPQETGGISDSEINSIVELRRMIVENDVFASLDTCLLLLLPLATFAIGVTPQLLNLELPWRELTIFTFFTVLVSLIVLTLLIHAKITGSTRGRMRAWAATFHFSAIFGLLCVSLVVIALLSLQPVDAAAMSLPVVGSTSIGHALAFRLGKWFRSKIEPRIPWQTPVIEAAFRETTIVRLSYASTTKQSITELLLGVVLLLLFPAIGVTNIERVWRYTIAILLIIPISIIALLIFESRRSTKR